MTDCLLANTSARNREIGVQASLSRALWRVQGALIHATQSSSTVDSTDAAEAFSKAAASIANAVREENKKRRSQRIRPLCNEYAFTIGHGHVGHIGTHQIMSRRTESTQREVSP
jgi:hypothetical protein